jgi:hypothetical protein
VRNRKRQAEADGTSWILLGAKADAKAITLALNKENQ